MDSLCHANPDGYDYPLTSGALGWVAAVPAVVGAATSVWGGIKGIFGGGDGLTAAEKGPMALRGPACGTYPYSVEEVAAAYMRAPQSVRARLREVISEISWMGPVLQSDADVVNAGMFFAEGGADCKHNRWDTAIKRVLDKLMADHGQPDYASTTGLPAGEVPAPTGALPPPPEWLTDLYEGWVEGAAPPPPAERPPVAVAGIPLKTLALYGGGAYLAARVLKVI